MLICPTPKPTTKKDALARLHRIEEDLHSLMADCDVSRFKAAADAIDHVVTYHTDAIRDAITGGKA